MNLTIGVLSGFGDWVVWIGVLDGVGSENNTVRCVCGWTGSIGDGGGGMVCGCVEWGMVCG